VVLLDETATATAHDRDAGHIGPAAYALGDRAQLLAAIEDARTTAEVEALAYIGADCTPLAACLNARLCG